MACDCQMGVVDGWPLGTAVDPNDDAIPLGLPPGFEDADYQPRRVPVVAYSEPYQSPPIIAIVPQADSGSDMKSLTLFIAAGVALYFLSRMK